MDRELARRVASLESGLEALRAFAIAQACAAQRARPGIAQATIEHAQAMAAETAANGEPRTAQALGLLCDELRAALDLPAND